MFFALFSMFCKFNTLLLLRQYALIHVYKYVFYTALNCFVSCF